MRRELSEGIASPQTRPVRGGPRGDASATSIDDWHPLVRAARGVLFDAGGTLVHPDWERLGQLAEAEAGRALTPDEMRRALYAALRVVDDSFERGGDDRQGHTKRPGWLFRDMFGALGVGADAAERMGRRIAAAHDERHLWCGLDPEAVEVIAELKRSGRRVAVISNTEDGRLRELLELVEIAAHFELLVDSHVVGLRKPDAAIFHHTLGQLKLTPEEVVYVGDSYGHDILGARRAGLRAVLLDPLDLYAGADCPRVRSLGELIGRGGVPADGGLIN